jgi:hypothetical protein
MAVNIRKTAREDREQVLLSKGGPGLDLQAIPSVEEDRKKIDLLNSIPRLDVRRQFQVASRLHGLSAASVTREIVELMVGPGQLTPQEYFYYRLYEPGLSMAEKRQFVGKREQWRITATCNNPTWSASIVDKLLFATVMAGLQLPAPRLLGVYHPQRRGVPDAAHLHSTEELRAFIERLTVPAFFKPVDGIHSVGSIVTDHVDRASQTVRLAAGPAVGIDQIVHRLSQSTHGYLIQERVRPHPDLIRLSGPTLSCVRLVILMGRHGPTIARTQFKIPAGGNVADNYWRGNMLSAVDPSSGVIQRVVRGTGVDQTFPTHHPDTGEPLIGAALPNWEELKQLGLKAAVSFPQIGIQAWDIAIGDKGPIIIECNSGGDFSAPQNAWGRGVLDEQFTAFVGQFGYAAQRPSLVLPLWIGKAVLRRTGLTRSTPGRRSRLL